MKHVYDTVRSARQEILLTVPGEIVLGKHSPDFEAILAMRDLDSRVHVLVAPPPEGPQSTQPREFDMLAELNVRISRVPRPTSRMAVIDRRILVVAQNRDDYADGALTGQGLPFIPMLASSLLGGAPPLQENPLATEQRTVEVLRQLAQGATDEAAARELGMALRTYRRVVARIMKQLQARSRFQAGVMAARQEWVSYEQRT
ncbi:LuxR C-terminal-related transcriptional regulator [Streptomyces globisporus]|uniref:helix-turn-helix transcriptional regulator n=1 Tax=Streptomyces globisporus TaxID=1908 RepID=UPI0037AEF725